MSTTDVSGLTADQRSQFQVKADKGALVTEVVPQSGADAGGLQVGDVITAVDGKGIGAAADVRAAIIKLKPGDKVKITVDRGGNASDLQITLGRRDAGA